MKRKLLWILASALLVAGCTKRPGTDAPSRNEPVKLRLGHFPNITHVQGLVAHALSRQGKGWFEERLGSGVEIQWFAYNAGPSAMEAIFANSLDVTYVGPSPALNAFAKSAGSEIRIVSGAVNGGAALVVQPAGNFKTAADFRGKKIASPQLGNTQDVSARAWLSAGGLRITQMGGDAQVLPTANPDQLSLFQQKKVDGVWTVEPWVTRLVSEAGGVVLVEEPEAITTVLVSSVRFSKEKRDLLQKFVQAHRELTEWVKQNPEQAQQLVQAELSELTKSKVSLELVQQAWKRIVLTNDVSRPSLEHFVQSAQAAGFLKNAPDVGGMLLTP